PSGALHSPGAERLSLDARQAGVDAELAQPLLRAGLRAHPGHHLPRCAPPSTCSTSPVMRGASVRKRTASTISWTLEMLCMGESVFRKSFGLSLCSGVSTTPGATVLARICSFAYSMAMFFDMASMPPLVSMATEAFTPAIG